MATAQKIDRTIEIRESIKTKRKPADEREAIAPLLGISLQLA